jgi:hypothetical protein
MVFRWKSYQFQHRQGNFKLDAENLRYLSIVLIASGREPIRALFVRHIPSQVHSQREPVNRRKEVRRL